MARELAYIGIYAILFNSYIRKMRSSGDYNTIIFLLFMVGFWWITKIGWRLYLAFDIFKRVRALQSTSEGGLYLEGMGAFANDFRKLQRNHFNQILRVKKTIAPTAVPRIMVKAGIDSASAALFTDPDAKRLADGDSKRGYGFTCKLSTSSPETTVQLYWGVSISILKEMFRLNADDVVIRVDTRGGTSTGFSNLIGNRLLRNVAATSENARSLLEMEELDDRLLSTQSSDQGDFNSFISPMHYVRRSLAYQFGVGLNQIFRTSSADMYDVGSMLDLLSYNQVTRTASGAAADLRSMSGNQRHVLREPSPLQDHNNYGIPMEPSATGVTWRPSPELSDEEERKALHGEPKVPLVIVVTTSKSSNSRNINNAGALPIAEGFCEVSLAKIRREGQGLYTVDVVKQVVLCSNNTGPQEGQDIYGLEDERERDCLICMTNTKDTMLLPCRHCSLCFDCLRSLRQEKCPLCRTNFSSFITFPIKRVPTPSHTTTQNVRPGHAEDTGP